MVNRIRAEKAQNASWMSNGDLNVGLAGDLRTRKRWLTFEEDASDRLVNNSLCLRDMAHGEIYHGTVKETEYLVAAPAALGVTIFRHRGLILASGLPELVVPFAQYSGVGGVQ